MTSDPTDGSPRAAATYEQQLAERVAELLPGMASKERLELLGVMDPDDMRTSLAFVASMYPQVFDFALVRDRAMIERLQARLGEDNEDDIPDLYCSACGAESSASSWAMARPGCTTAAREPWPARSSCSRPATSP